MSETTLKRVNRIFSTQNFIRALAIGILLTVTYLSIPPISDAWYRLLEERQNVFFLCLAAYASFELWSIYE